jgi:hypothetical protein
MKPRVPIISSTTSVVPMPRLLGSFCASANTAVQAF